MKLKKMLEKQLIFFFIILYFYTVDEYMCVWGCVGVCVCVYINIHTHIYIYTCILYMVHIYFIYNNMCKAAAYLHAEHGEDRIIGIRDKYIGNDLFT